jgi:hypothetical protein
MISETTCFSELRGWDFENLKSGQKGVVKAWARATANSATAWFGVEDGGLPEDLYLSLFVEYDSNSSEITVGHSISLASDEDQTVFSIEELAASDFEEPSKDAAGLYILGLIGENFGRIKTRIYDLEVKLLHRAQKFMLAEGKAFARESTKVHQMVSESSVIDHVRAASHALAEKGLPFSSALTWGIGTLPRQAEVKVPVRIGDPNSDHFRGVESNLISLPLSQLYVAYLDDNGLGFSPLSGTSFWFELSTNSFEELPDSFTWDLRLNFKFEKHTSDCEKELAIDFLATLTSQDSTHLDPIIGLLGSGK